MTGTARSWPVGVATVAGLTWLLALTALIIDLSVLPEPAWQRGLWAAVLGGAPPAAFWAAASRRAHLATPAAVRERRSYGSLAVLSDGERRPLRPIAATACEVAALTVDLLAEFLATPGLWVFYGVRTPGATLPCTAHVISSGRQLMLLESVAWPPGRYETIQERVHCDGVYIGQSAGPLLAAVQHWRQVLPRNHGVRAVVIVHPCSRGELSLPAAINGDVAWIRAEDAPRDLPRRIAPGRRPARARVLAALIAATEPGPPGRSGQ